MEEPRAYAWIVPERVAVAERPGGCGRGHRREARIAELDWWRDHGCGIGCGERYELDQ